MRSPAVLVILMLTARMFAQVEGVPRDLIEQRIEAAAENASEESEVDLSTLFDVLTDRYLDPIDLNHTDQQELNSLLLLSDLQINAILQHIQRNGKLISIYELQTIPSLDARTIAMMRPFVTVREDARGTTASFKEMWKNAAHEWSVRSTITLQQRKGFMDRRNPFGMEYGESDGLQFTDREADSLRANSKVYLGSPYRIYSRYRLRYRHNISLGVTVEKDEGEQFFNGTQNGFDFSSAHLFLRDIGRFKAIAIGDHAAQFGQGLAFWNGLSFSSKSSFTMNVKRNAIGLLPYTSVNEDLFLRGAGATYEIMRGLELTGLVSFKRIDANVGQAAEPDEYPIDDPPLVFSGFKEDGYHRTHNELAKKDAIGERIVAGHLRWKRSGYSIGTTFSHVEFAADLVRNTRPYNMFDLQGRINTTGGIDWNVLHRNANWFGEIARSSNGAVAFNSGILVALDRRVSLSLMYRNYDRDFQSLYSAAFAEGTDPRNESGIYAGIEIRANRSWTINAYADGSKSQWLRYLTDAPSHGTDWLVQVNWRPDKRVEIYARARHQDRQKNDRGDFGGPTPLAAVKQIEHRINASYRISPSIVLRTRFQTVDVKHGNAPLEHGSMIYQDLVHRPLQGPIELTLRFAIFETGGWDSRVYAFENDLIGTFSIPPHYGRGTRWYTMIRLSPLPGIDLWLRYGAWTYRDQDVIGSGLQEIRGNVRSDLRAQLRWRF